jgi:hypothetical protein
MSRVEQSPSPNAGTGYQGKPEVFGMGWRCDVGGLTFGGLHTTCEAGEVSPGDPVEGRKSRNFRRIGGKDGGNLESHNRLNETATHSDTGQ